ncbi:MFS transporter [Tumebacillus permanentifrigoris]|uniref:DHA1 family multidrug resistance protein B-like MFS transporter n=1 Tax=Tumebacillus permanentifrigoris TaxID=378543 RepID=A0A316D827_9BACL|nr:MFS transporter [Tumebacillus permanentifrigoris]PWK11297.1 DHA1 family multidrug resistance protein B-like MFS transporter [Tumebacillus permanentifrigoris]
MRYRDLHINLKVRLVEAFLVNLVGNMIYPFMAIYFADRYGPVITGYLFMANILIGLSFGLYGGVLADKYGRRHMLRIAETGRVLSMLIITLSNSPWFDSPLLTLIFLLVLNGFGGLAFPAVQAMIVDCTTPDNRKFVYSIDYWALNTSLLIGGMVGAFFFRSYLFELFSAATFISFGSLCLLLFVIQETHYPKPVQTGEGKQKSKGGGYGMVFRDRTFMLYILAVALLISLEQIFFNYGGVRLSQEMSSQSLFSWGNRDVQVDGVGMFGILRTENALLVVLLSVLAARVFSRFRDTGVLMTGILLTMIGFAVLAVSNSPWTLLVCMLIATSGELLHTSIRQSYLAEIVPAANRGTYMALTGLTGVIAQMIGAGSITAGAYVTPWVLGIATLVIGVVSAGLFVNTLLHLPERKRAMQAEEALQQVASN